MSHNTAFSPFLLMQQWQTMAIKQSAALIQANIAAMETIYHRTSMMGKVAEGKLSPNHPEFSRMLQEKMHAGMKGQMAMLSAWQNAMMRYCSTPKTGEDAMKCGMKVAEQLYEAATAPGFSAVNRNAKRLRNKN